jgi:dihydrodipicolinate synthase/N-acetylneuraminate lyase
MGESCTGLEDHGAEEGRAQVIPKAISGVCPVIAVPFSDDGSVDLDGFDSLVDHLVQIGVSALTLFGLASEFHKLTDSERHVLASRLLLRTRNAGVAAVISVTDHATEVAVDRARAFADEGADALMVLPPYFMNPSQAAIAAHIEAVLSAVKVPVIVQYAPVQTGARLDPSFWVGLRQRHPTFRLVKVEAQPSGRYVSALKNASGGSLGSLVGYAGVHLPDALRRGAVGVVPGCSFAEVYVELMRLWNDGDEAGFSRLHSRLLPYISYWMQDVELIVQSEKSILHRRGLIAGDRCRRPGYTLDGEELRLIDRFLEAFDGLLDPGTDRNHRQRPPGEAGSEARPRAVASPDAHPA